MTDVDSPNQGLPRVLRDGRYALGRVLGQGGMAIVCIAHDNELGVDRAIKLLTPRGASRDTLRRRLRAEARAMARLNHPNILSVHDVGSEGDFDYVVMDLAEGGSLQDLAQAGPLAPALAVHHMIQVLSALSAAHAANVVHRDVKPHNVLLDRAGRALLADFGIALLAGDDRRTRSGVAMGSLAFMPPEQRLDASRVGPAADIYAAGSTLYSLVTGANPVDLFLAGADSPRWEHVPPALIPVLRKACAMMPDERYPDAASMEAALVGLLPAMETLAVPPGTATLPVPLEGHTATRPALFEGRDHGTLTAEATSTSLPVPPAPRSPVLLAALTALAAVLTLAMWIVPGRSTAPSDPASSGAAGIEPVAVAPVPPPPGEPGPTALVEPEPLAAPSPPSAPEPAPVVAVPAPAPVGPAPSAPPQPDGGSVTGRWTGSLNGIQVRVDLAGADGAVRGTVTTTFGDNLARSEVQGALQDGTLELADIDTDSPSASRYTLSLTDDGGTLNGRVTRNTGGVKPLILRRSP